MNIARDIGKVSAQYEALTWAHKFIAISRLRAVSSAGELQAAAKAMGLESVAAAHIKTAIDAGSIGAGGWAEPLGEWRLAVNAFLESQTNFGAFDRMLGSMKRVPLRTWLGSVSLAATATVVSERSAIPLSSLSIIGNKKVDAECAVAIIAMTNELLNFSGAGSNNLFEHELRKAVAFATDQRFFQIVTDGVTPVASNGGTSIAILQDVAQLFDDLTTDAASSVFICVESSTAKAWATKTTADGAIAFPGMGPKGGTICSTPVIVSDGLTAGTIVAVDANGIAGNIGNIEVDRSSQADLQFETTPNSPPVPEAVLKNLWQHGMSALRATRWFGAERLGANSVAVISGVSYSGNSPE